MDQKDWENTRESRINKALIDRLRKKISEEDYDKIRKQGYEEYMEELRAAEVYAYEASGRPEFLGASSLTGQNAPSD